MQKTEDNYTPNIGDRLAEVGQYFNNQWFIRPHIVSKHNIMFSINKYFKKL